MIEKINNIINKTTDKILLKTLKLEITKENANVDQIINRYINEYEEENNIKKTNYKINLGFEKNIKDYKKTINKLRPCANPQNYREMTIKARGEWKHIYEIAFGTKNTTITTKMPADEKTKQFKIKEAA